MVAQMVCHLFCRVTNYFFPIDHDAVFLFYYVAIPSKQLREIV